MGEGTANKEKRKAEINLVVLDCREYQYEFMIFKTYVHTEGQRNKYRWVLSMSEHTCVYSLALFTDSTRG